MISPFFLRERSAVLLGDVALQSGDLRAAFKAWSRAVSLPVFDRIEELLKEGRLDDLTAVENQTGLPGPIVRR